MGPLTRTLDLTEPPGNTRRVEFDNHARVQDREEVSTVVAFDVGFWQAMGEPNVIKVSIETP